MTLRNKVKVFVGRTDDVDGKRPIHSSAKEIMLYFNKQFPETKMSDSMSREELDWFIYVVFTKVRPTLSP